MGEPGYVMSSLLIPMPRTGIDVSSRSSGQNVLPATQMHFKAVSVHTNAGGYVLSMNADRSIIKHRGRTYPMSDNCADFWTPSNSDLSAYDASPGQDEAP